MLAKENKIFSKVLSVLFISLIMSCGPTTEKIDIFANNEFANNKEAYNTIVDSITYYTNSNLKEFSAEYLYNWQVDSVICINSHNDRLVAVILLSVGVFKDEVSDDATKILGKKINGNWYFFKGSTLVIPRSNYGKTGSTPLSFHELSQIARKEMLESALIKNDDGEYVVNDKWVDAHFYNNGYYFIKNPKISGVVSPGEEFQMPRDKHIADSMHWDHIMDKWKHKIDTNEYKPLKRFKKDKPVS